MDDECFRVTSGDEESRCVDTYVCCHDDMMRDDGWKRMGLRMGGGRTDGRWR